MMQRTWTQIGKPHTEGNEEKLAAYFDRLEWKPLTGSNEEAMMPALGIQSTIKQLRLPMVSHYAISFDMAPFGLYGVRCQYKNGLAQVYVCDEGCQIVPLCSDFWPGEVVLETVTTTVRREVIETQTTLRCTKRAVIRDAAVPIGQPAPLHINCGCGQKLTVNSDAFTGKAPDELIPCPCGITYDSRGYVQNPKPL